MPKLTRADLAAFYQESESKSPAGGPVLRVGTSTCGVAAGADLVCKALSEAVAAASLTVPVRRVGCLGMCYAEPLVEAVSADGIRAVYGPVTAADAVRIVTEHIVAGRVCEDLIVAGTAERGTDVPDAVVLPDGQVRIVLRNCGVIDPTRIEEYVARGGYRGLERALFDLGPEGVIAEMKASGLRGRGGAGYPTWIKWKLTREQQSPEKYVICNGDEGDPGAYMDRSVLEGDPHAVVEGMIIAGWAMGATQGYFYIRAEYPLAVERIENAIRQAKRVGLLGKDILGSGFNFDLEIRLGAGAFVCGEETALIASIEGKRGTPRPRPPFPSQRGLWDMPTNINNVETLANIAPIMRNGGEWYAQFGTEKSPGTKVFAVTGKVMRSGLVEIPMGLTLRHMVMNIGGGVAPGQTVKAVQTGGPSGGVIPERLFDTPVSYETLQELGSIMGSGGLIVMDDRDSMTEIARFYVGFSVDESCGKCAPCRIGTKQLLLLLDRIAEGGGCDEDIVRLRRISHSMQKASLCGLGQTAPNPVLSTLKYFGEEYQKLMVAAN